MGEQGGHGVVKVDLPRVSVEVRAGTLGGSRGGSRAGAGWAVEVRPAGVSRGRCRCWQPSQPLPCLSPAPVFAAITLPSPTWMSGCLPSAKLLLSLVETFLKFLPV